MNKIIRDNILKPKSYMKRIPFVIAGVAALLLIAVLTVSPAMADTKGCPSLNGRLVSNIVNASFETVDNTVTYKFTSVDRNPENGVPGLISYCVYPTPTSMPDNVITIAIGADGEAWDDPQTPRAFSFDRPKGNPTNIPLNGATITMGTATWDSGVPDTQVILLHINDADECDELYHDNPGTCWVLPDDSMIIIEEPTPPEVSKDAIPSFDRTYEWTIEKKVDKTIVKQVGGTATFNYEVIVSHNGGTNSNWQVSGEITISNPNIDPITGVDLTDAVNNGGSCVVTGGTNITVPGDSSVTRSYVCEYGAEPSPLKGINTVTATWPEQLVGIGTLPAGSASFDAAFDFGSVSPNLIDDSVTVSDPNATNPPLSATVSSTDPSLTTFTYSREIVIPTFDCLSYDNTATFTTNTTGTTGSDSQTVTVCGPAKTGALTMGFWQNKNGQGIINGGSSTSATKICNSGTWLRNYAPFQDLSYKATCSGVATYVTTVIKAADASGASMNKMLKAQMLATALDVYFSDPALGGNKINAPSPIGGVKIDLTMICTNLACTAYQDVSSAFDGETSLMVNDLLTKAAFYSDVGGIMWYGNIKATQELAKDTFDAINNQKAFGT